MIQDMGEENDKILKCFGGFGWAGVLSLKCLFWIVARPQGTED